MNNKYIKGAIGLTQSALNIGIAQEDVINNRLEICKDCPFNQKIGRHQKCSKCGCNIAKKTRLMKHGCPIGKW